MDTKSLQKAIMAGVAGTVVMTVFSFISNYLSLPRFDLHGTIAGHFNMGDLMGWVAYFAVGILMAYAYGAFFKAKLPMHSWQRGIAYAVILWGFTEAIVMPVFGMGFFAGGIAATFTGLLTFGLYGATVGYLYEH